MTSDPQNAPPEIAGYHLITWVGQGAVGAVYRARQISMDREVALKVLHPELTARREVVDKYLSEARAVAKMNHPHIVRGYDVGESGGCHYFSMEFLAGGSLEEYLARHGPLSEKTALIYLYQIVTALEHAWEHDVIHCDIKPANLMLDAQQQLRVTDLGLSRVGREAAVAAQKGARVVRGTPHYISLEQIRFPDQLDCRTDIYSLGATFYHLLSGRTPFTGADSKEIVLARLRQQPEPLSHFVPAISRSFSDLIAHMMAPRRTHRPQTPAELRQKILDIGVDVHVAGDLAEAVRASARTSNEALPLRLRRKATDCIRSHYTRHIARRVRKYPLCAVIAVVAILLALLVSSVLLLPVVF